MNYLTDQQLAAVKVSNGLPAYWLNPDTSEVTIILPSEEYAWIRGLVTGLPDIELSLEQGTQKEFVMLPQSIYDRIKPFFEEVWPTPRERLSQLRDFGQRAGWSDPEMDAYEEYRKKP